MKSIHLGILVFFTYRLLNWIEIISDSCFVDIGIFYIILKLHNYLINILSSHFIKLQVNSNKRKMLNFLKKVFITFGSYFGNVPNYEKKCLFFDIRVQCALSYRKLHTNFSNSEDDMKLFNIMDERFVFGRLGKLELIFIKILFRSWW